MRIKTVLFIIILFMDAALNMLHAQFIHTYVDTDSLQVGDVFTYTIVFDGNYDHITFPSEEVFQNELDVLSRQRFQLTSRRDSLVFTLQFFGTNDITIGRKEIFFTEEGRDSSLFTVPVPLFFKTSLADGDDEFRPIKPIFLFARNWWPLMFILLLVLLALFFFYRWYVKREPQSEPVPVSPPDPFIDPIDELKHILSVLPGIHMLNSREDYESYYMKLGDAIRFYLKRVYNFPALEMTTREIHESLQKELAPSEIIQITRKVLNEADLVKFANFIPDSEQAASVLRKANNFIETASIVNYEQIKYMKYRYEVEQGILKTSSPNTLTSSQKI